MSMHWRGSPSPVKLRYLEHARGVTVLDVGTGPGFYGAELARRDFHVTGLDLHPLTGVPFQVLQGRLSQLPFAAPFDTVLALDVLEHEPDEARALAELRRLTTQRLILSVPNADDALLHAYNLTYKHHVDKTHVREYHMDELRGKLEGAGFRVLFLHKEGPVSAALLSEFVRPRAFGPCVALGLKALQRLRLLQCPDLLADIYCVAEPVV